MSWFFKTVVNFRHRLYESKILPVHFATLPVVSIGNVVVGGAGKTQVALFLAEALSKEMRVAILSRGYLSKAEHAKEPVHVDVEKHTALECGDEPWMLASRLKSTFVLVNKNRFKSALKAEKLGAQMLVLDDGMQHRELHRDFEFVVLDGSDPFGGGHFFPKGRLRDDLRQLKRADLILFIGSPTEEIKGKVAQLTEAKQVEMKINATKIFSLAGEKIESIQNRRVAVFCGIGNPQRFVNSIEACGADVVASHFARDHDVMKEKSLYQFAARSKERGAEYLLCTEKDKVKLPSLNPPLPIGWVRADLEIVKNRGAWDKTLSEMKYLAGIPQ